MRKCFFSLVAYKHTHCTTHKPILSGSLVFGSVGRSVGRSGCIIWFTFGYYKLTRLLTYSMLSTISRSSLNHLRRIPYIIRRWKLLHFCLGTKRGSISHFLLLTSPRVRPFECLETHLRAICQKVAKAKAVPRARKETISLPVSLETPTQKRDAILSSLSITTRLTWQTPERFNLFGSTSQVHCLRAPNEQPRVY